MSGDDIQGDLNPLTACTISRDVQNFDLLIEDMEAELGENWGDLGFADALAFFQQPEAEALEFIALAVDDEDEDQLPLLEEIIISAKGRGIGVILIAEDLSSVSLHHLLRKGADEFVPYPLPETELAQAIERLKAPAPAPVAASPAAAAGPAAAVTAGNREGAVIAIQGLAGGVGASTIAVNLAWELVNVDKESPRVCLLDFGLQYGAAATYLDLPRREAIYELWSDTEAMDPESFVHALQSFNEKLHVLTSPADILPLDFITPDDVTRVIEAARTQFDYVVIDLPTTLVQWSETVLNAAHVYLALIELDMRSAQNALRLKRALQAEELPFEKIRWALNRAPKFTDLNGKARVKRMAESLGISIDLQMPDGGKPVTQGNDHGVPLAETAAKNPLRKELAKLAASLHAIGKDDTKAA